MSSWNVCLLWFEQKLLITDLRKLSTALNNIIGVACRHGLFPRGETKETVSSGREPNGWQVCTTSADA